MTEDDERARVNNVNLRAQLAEDMGSEAEADDLLPVMLRLKRWQTAGASGPQREQLLVRLREAAANRRSASRLDRWLEWRPLLVLRAQIPMVQREIWLASVFLMALGAVLTLLTAHLVNGSLTFVLFAPIVAATGIALLYNDEMEQVMEIERATPDPVGVILLARMSLVFGFDTFLGVIASLIITALESSLLLWPFVLSWLAPMTLLSSLAFLISVIWRDSVAGILTSMSLWCGYHIWRIASNGLRFTVDYELITAAPYLMLAAVPIGGLALWLVEHREGATRITDHVD